MGTRAHYDTIVIGAGPAGAAAALVLARKGARVLLLEREESPGEGTAASGVIYGDELKGFGLADLLPGFEAEAPLERRITSHEVTAVSEPDAQTGAYRSYRLTDKSLLARLGLFTVGPPSGRDHSVLRRRFDPWLAGKAMEAGALLCTQTPALGLLIEGGSVAGVETPHEEATADVVIDCSGVTSPFPEAAGVRKALGPRQLYQGITRTYALGEEAVERRFKLREGEGRVMEAFGPFMQGVSGSGVVCTNRDTVTVGVVASMDSMVRSLTERFEEVGKPLDLLRAFEAHPMVADLLEGGEPLACSARNLPKGPRAMPRSPCADGYLVAGDALGAFVRIGGIFDGLRLAIASGAMAAETYLAARVSGSFRASNLSRYRDMLAPVYEEVSRSGRENFFSESGLAHDSLPRMAFSSSMFSERVEPGVRPAAATPVPATWDARGAGGSVRVDADLGSMSSSKPWVPSCPTDCFTLVTPKGRFHSHKELYDQNLRALGGGASGRALEVQAYRETVKDVESARLSFDGAACVSCGTCWAVGPPSIVAPAPRATAAPPRQAEQV